MVEVDTHLFVRRQGKVSTPQLKWIQASSHGAVETNLISIHEDAGLTSGPAQWVKDLALLCTVVQIAEVAQIWHCWAVVEARIYSSDLTPSLRISICHRCSPLKKKKRCKTNFPCSYRDYYTETNFKPIIEKWKEWKSWCCSKEVRLPWRLPSNQKKLDVGRGNAFSGVEKRMGWKEIRLGHVISWRLLCHYLLHPKVLSCVN